MFNIIDGINFGKQHIKCPNCNNELSIIFGGLFGQQAKKVVEAKIKYISGCCFEDEYFFCEECNKYYNKKLLVVK